MVESNHDNLKIKHMHKQFQPVIILPFSKIRFVLILVFGLVIITLFSPDEGLAQGNLLIMPRRVVFEGSKKSQELTLANTGKDTAKYLVSIVQMRMKEDGSFEQITKPDSGQFFADKYLRFFPRSVTLPPGQSQTIKMQLAKSNKMVAGEYRSHIYFRSVPNETPLGTENPTRDSTAVSVKLVPVFGITIPSIVRVGECSVRITLNDLSFEMNNDTTPSLRLTFVRTGNISVYGDLVVNHTSPEGKVTKVATVKGVAVYTPNPIRKFSCTLDKTLGVDYHTGKLNITYSSPEDAKTSRLAEAELLLR